MNTNSSISTPDIIEVNYLAKMLQSTFENESKDSQIALVWCIRNRIEAGAPLAEVVLALPMVTRSNPSEVVAAAGMIAYVFGSGCPDPTSGARRFHRHDAHPPWAARLEPCALIGSYFYYCD